MKTWREALTPTWAEAEIACPVSDSGDAQRFQRGNIFKRRICSRMQGMDEARSAALDRGEYRFSTKSSDGEQFELRNALEALSVLRKFAHSEIGLLCRA